MSDETLRTIADDLRLLSEEHTAELLGWHVQTLRKKRRAGEGPPAVRVGAKRWRYRVATLRDWQDGLPKATPRQAAAAMRAYFGDGEAA